MLASDRIQGNFCSLASVALAMVLAGGSYVTGQIIVPAAEINGQSGDFGAQSSDVNQQAYQAPAVSPDAQTLLKDARSAIGVRNYELAAQLIGKAQSDPAAAQLAYTPAMAQQELYFWMQQEGKLPSADAATSDSTSSMPTNQTTSAGPASANLSEAEIEATLRTFLQARQALAHGDTVTTQLMLESVSNREIDFAQIGDSPEFIQAMIDRQNELTAMASLQDPAYNELAAGFLLSQAEALIHYNDFENASLLINQAKSFPVDHGALPRKPEDIENLMATAKSRLKSTDVPAQAVAQPAHNKTEATKLISMAQLAIAKEDWYEASSLIEQAKSYNVPETEYAADEVRPWQLELQVRNALNRSGVDAKLSDASGEQSSDFAVAQASASDADESPVVQAMYDPDNDDTFNSQVAGYDPEVTPASAIEPVKEFTPMPSRGVQLFKSGMDALSRADKAKAKEYFESAWQFEDQLDATTRQTVQEQLTRLGVSTSAGPSGPNQETLELDQVRMQRQKDYRRLQSEVFKQREAAERALEENPRDALEIMTTLRNRISQSNLDRDSQRPLLVSVDRNISEMQEYIENNLPEIENRERNASNLKKVEDNSANRVETEKQMQQLVEEYNTLMNQERYGEAMLVVRQAVDLDPGSEIATVLKEKATRHIRAQQMADIKEAKESSNYEILESVEAGAIQGSYDNPYTFNDPDSFSEKSRNRIAKANQRNYGSDAERLIWNKLRNEKVQGEFRGTLNEAIVQLTDQTGINIIFDELALRAEGIERDAQIDVPIISPISLQSALEVILNSAGLVYVVENEVIKVTSRGSQQTNLATKIYYIGDLVVPHSAPTNPFHMNFMQPNGGNQLGGSFNVAQQGNPVLGQQLGGGNGLGGLSFGGGNGPQAGSPSFSSLGGRQLGGITEGDFEPLIELIQNTIQTESWLDTGSGLGTIQPFVSNLSLIVTQTQEIQDEIQDLLKKLRELNDVQIVVEVRFMTLADDFFEQIGVDFDFNLNDNAPPGIGTGSAPAVNNFGDSAVVGFDPGGNGEQNIQFTQNSIGAALSLFGAQGDAAANFGFAILSDIEVFFMLEAAQGNTRTNVMQAPTVTMFNGQSASISDGSQQPFVVGVVPVVGDFAVGQQPIITLIPNGTNLSVQATVSEDRRFVRLNLSPFFSEITDVQTFTFDGATSTERSTDSVLDDLLDLVDGGSIADAGDDELITETSGVTVQQPVVSFTSVNTVVSVPDGGTVLMGGIKRLSEQRTEQGVPLLSSIPYINRLFRNVGIGQEASNLMMMVTPRILIQEELEEDQVGLINN